MLPGRASRAYSPWSPCSSLLFGVLLGTWGGALPGVGGPSQLAVLLPFAMVMEPFNAIAFLIGVTTVGNTGNTFTSVLVAVPGGSGAQATVLDGYPMARNGEAARALSAAFMVSMLGGIFGAFVLFASLPVLREIVRSFGSPELFMFTIWGLSMLGTISSGAPLKGLTAGIIGVLLSTIGQDDKSGVIRFDVGLPYLWDGVSVVLISLSIFAIPEMIALAGRKGRVAEIQKLGSGLLQGIRDAFRHWWLMIRCSAIGVWVGVLPGLGSDVADWFAYAHARQTERNSESFGRGDVRGVIAPESSNNAKEGGALITTLAFGIPGSTSMALLLIAFVAVGLTPGPEMLTDQFGLRLQHHLGAGVLADPRLGGVLGPGEAGRAHLLPAVLRAGAVHRGAGVPERLRRQLRHRRPGGAPVALAAGLPAQDLRLAPGAGGVGFRPGPQDGALSVAVGGPLRHGVGVPARASSSCFLLVLGTLVYPVIRARRAEAS